MERLSVLAVQLMNCRKRGNKLTLECVLESARILTEAKSIAGARFGTWLVREARMDRSTAYRHLAVGHFVRQHVALTRQIASLSLAKIYALSSADSTLAVRVLTGQIKFTAPIDLISDLQFRREFRGLVPARPRRLTPHHVFQSATSALTRAERAVQAAAKFARTMTPAQKTRLEQKVQALARLVSGWKGVA